MSHMQVGSASGDSSDRKAVDPALAGILAEVTEAVTDTLLYYSPDGTLLWASPSLQRVFGWEPDEVVGTHFRLATPVGSPELLRAVFSWFDVGVDSWQCRTLGAHRDGRRMWVEESVALRRNPDASPAAAVVSVRDVTAQVLSENSLLESERFFRALADAASDCAFHIDGDHAMEWISDGAAELIGNSAATFRGKPFESLIDPADADHVRVAVDRALQGLGSRLTFRIRVGDGPAVPVRGGLDPFFNPEGKVIGVAIGGHIEDLSFSAATGLPVRSNVTEPTHALDVLEQVPDILLDVRASAPGGRSRVVRWASPSLSTQLGWLPWQWTGEEVAELVHADDLQAFEELLARPATGEPAPMRIRLLGKDGSYRWFEALRGTGTTTERDSHGVLVSCRRADLSVARESRLERRAQKDNLTGLLNRGELVRSLERLDGHQFETGRQTAVLFADIDGLKAINDTFGHVGGDRLLRQVAARIRQSVRLNDLAARVGGDEILIVLRALRGIEEAHARAEDIRRAVAQPIQIGSEVVIPSVSIGVTLLQPRETPEEMIERADRAMYRAKREGRNRVVEIPPAAAMAGADRRGWTGQPDHGQAGPPEATPTSQSA